MVRPLSIGARLALRYTAAMAVTMTAFAGIVYQQVAQRINREATLLLEVQLNDLANAINSQSREHSRQHVLRWMKEHTQQAIGHSEPSLGLGIELLDVSGQALVSGGSLAGAELPLSQALLDGRREASPQAIDLGGRFVHLSMAEPVNGGFVRVAIDTTRYADNVAAVRRVFAVSLPLVLLMTAAAGWYLAAQSLRPIATISATARRIGSSNLRESVPLVGTGDELDELAVTLNEMLSRIQDGVDRMQRFNANAAHQLRTPLTAIRSEVEVTLERPRTPDAYRDALSDVLGDVRRMSDGVDAMLRLARSEQGLAPEQLSRVEIGGLLDEVVEFFSPLALEREVELLRGPLEPSVVLGERTWLEQLFANLVSNAVQYTRVGDRVELSSCVRNAGVEVRVSDTGSGMEQAQIESVFDRFARRDGEVLPGFGLGLPIAKEIARAHGGTIEVDSTPGEGTTFSVWLPVAPSASPAQAAHRDVPA
jgi:heavy metal sensor kinase